MLYYLLFWTILGFIFHFYIIFGTNLLTGGPAQNCCFLPILVFRRNGISNGVQTKWNLRERDFLTERDPGDLDPTPTEPRSGHEGGGAPPRARPLELLRLQPYILCFGEKKIREKNSSRFMIRSRRQALKPLGRADLEDFLQEKCSQYHNLTSSFVRRFEFSSSRNSQTVLFDLLWKFLYYGLTGFYYCLQTPAVG